MATGMIRSTRRMTGSFSNSGRDSSSGLGVTLEGEVSGEPGEIDFDFTVSGKLGAGFGDVLSGWNRDSIKLVFSLDRPRRFTSQVNTQINSVKNLVGVLPSSIPSRASQAIPDDVRNMSAVGLQLRVALFGKTLGGRSPVSASKKIRFSPVKVPVKSSSGMNLSDLGTISVVVEARPSEAIQNALSGMGGARPTITLQVPPDAFIETVDISEFSCEELFEGINDTVSSLDSETRSPHSKLQRERDQITDAAQDLMRAGNLDTIRAVRQASTARFNNLSQGRLDQISSIAENADASPANLSQLERRITNTENKIADMSMSRCKSNFEGQVQDARQRVDEMKNMSREVEENVRAIRSALSGIGSVNCEEAYDSIQQEINRLENESPAADGFNMGQDTEIKSRIRNLKSQIRNRTSSGSPCENRFISRLDQLESNLASGSPGSELDCSNIPKDLRSNVSGLESSVQTFRQRNTERRRANRKNSMLTEGTQLISEIDSRVDGNNPCKGELMNRVNQSLSLAREADTRSGDAVPCSERFEGVGDQVRSFEQRVSQRRRSATPGDLQELIQNGKQIIEIVNNDLPDDSSCQDELAERVQSAIDRLGRMSHGVRIRSQITERERQTNIENIDNLRKQLQQMTKE